MVRYSSIDSFRGIAALMVVLFHLSGNLSSELAAILPEFVMSAMSFGYLGVPIFFVISGLVIALSVGKTNVTLGYFGNFALRRSIRLDPTYWAAILIALVLMNLKGLLGYADPELPSVSNVLFHMFYLQDILGVTPKISSVYWTLCLEIQLYLFYILALYVSQLRKTSHNEHSFTILAALFAFVSILSDYDIIPANRALFIPYWHYFFTGVLIYYVIAHNKNATFYLATWITIEICFILFINTKPYAIAAVLFALCLFTLWRTDKLNTAFTSKSFVFLGSISYTLYLIHPDVGWKFISIAKSVVGDSMNGTIALLIFLSSILVSIVAAYLLHLFVEKPTLRLSAKFKRR